MPDFRDQAIELEKTSFGTFVSILKSPSPPAVHLEKGFVPIPHTLKNISTPTLMPSTENKHVIKENNNYDGI